MALLNVNDVVRTVGALLDDPANLEFDQPYVMPFINLAWYDIAQELSALGLQYSEEVIEIASIPAGTTALTDYQQDGQPLDAMLLPTKVEWKRTNEDHTQYVDVLLHEDLPDVPAETEGIKAYQWRKAQLILTPSSIAVDLRVTFKAFSADFYDPSQQLIVGAGNLIAYKTGEIICAPGIRNNPAHMQYLAAKYREAADNFEVLCVKQKNREGFKIGRMHSRIRRGR